MNFVFDSVFSLMFLLLVISSLMCLAFTLYFYYYWFKMYIYLKNHRPEVHQYLTLKDLPFLEKVTNVRGEKWFYSDMDEDDEIIKEFKGKLKSYQRILGLFFVLSIFLFFLIVIINYLPSFTQMG